MVSVTESIKCVVVGDACAGKTALIIAYGEGRFPTEFVPTVSDSYDGKVEYDGKEIQLNIWDTSGMQEYEYIRQL